MLLSNYKEHPTKNNYLVFQYTNANMAKCFEELMNEKGIDFESDISDFGTKTLYLYGVKTIHRKEAVHSNFVAYGKHRKPLVRWKILRGFMLLFVVAIITFGTMGYLYKTRYGVTNHASLKKADKNNRHSLLKEKIMSKWEIN